ncbi:MAG: putative membrane protein [Halioglobus sp.]|jgi:uncharacterized membrane protein
MASANHAVENYPIRNVPLTRPFIWLSEGWDDLLHHRAASLAYGLLVSVLGALILAYGRHPFYIAAVWTGFLLVGPILTAGLCELSRCRDEGEVADFSTSLLPLSRNRSSLLGVAETMALIALVWFALSGAIYVGFVGSVAPTLESTVWGDVLRQLSSTQLIVYGSVGIILCAIVFALSVVTVPMIVDHHVDGTTAMRTSLRVAVRDFPAMLVWAALIAGLVLLGFLTGLIGMVVIFPLLGHATWRAYKELVE